MANIREGYESVNVQLPPPLLQLLDKHRSGMGMTRANTLRQALYHYLNLKSVVDRELGISLIGGTLHKVEAPKIAITCNAEGAQ